ncbi:hypothetical protein D3C85_999520 [compost metagenome]
MLYGALGDQDGILAYPEFYGHAHELAGQQLALLVVEDGAGTNGAGLGIDPVIREVDLARIGIDGAICEADMGTPVSAVQGLQLAALEGVLEGEAILLRVGEVHIEGIELGDGSEQATVAAGGDEAALGL